MTGRKRRRSSSSWFLCGCCVREEKISFDKKGSTEKSKRENYFIADDFKIVTRDKGGKVEWNAIELRDWKSKSLRKNGVIGESENKLRHRLFPYREEGYYFRKVHHLQLSLFVKGYCDTVTVWRADPPGWIFAIVAGIYSAIKIGAAAVGERP